CNSFTWIDGVTYTSSNNSAKDTLTNAAGCDSVVTLNLTIYNGITITYNPVDKSTLVGSSAYYTVSTIETSLSYQWYEDNGSGFSALSNSSVYSGVSLDTLRVSPQNTSYDQNLYRCIINDVNGCSDTTSAALLSVGITSTEENEFKSSLTIFPNPTMELLNIKTNMDYSTFKIINSIGQVIYYNTPDEVIDVSNFSAGKYLLLFYKNDKLMRQATFIKK
ncbi:MAG: T9SS type A sorting domain-containing protein, partial [Flavobacteriales bacterium]